MQYHLKIIRTDTNIIEPTHKTFQSKIVLKPLPLQLVKNARELLRRTNRKKMACICDGYGNVVHIGSYDENFVESMKL